MTEEAHENGFQHQLESHGIGGDRGKLIRYVDGAGSRDTPFPKVSSDRERDVAKGDSLSGKRQLMGRVVAEPATDQTFQGCGIPGDHDPEPWIRPELERDGEVIHHRNRALDGPEGVAEVVPQRLISVA